MFRAIYLTVIWSVTLQEINAECVLSCQFPFIYKGVNYTECTTIDDPEKNPWCSTETDSQDKHVRHQWRHCNSNDGMMANAGNNSSSCLTYPDETKGRCVPISECPRLNKLRVEMLKALKSNIPIDVTILRRSVCLSPSMVCCEFTAIPTLSECGKRSGSDLIVGGSKATWWPWLVLFLGKYSPGEELRPFCGGSLLNRRFVITAAHCFTAKINIESVRFGELDLTRNPDEHGGICAPQYQERNIHAIYNHPDYQKDGCLRCNDIAIVEMDLSVEIIDGFVSPICLPVFPQDMGFSEEDFDGKEAITAGWGVYDQEDWYNPEQPDHLQELYLPIKKTPFCEERMKFHPNGSIICAGSGNGKDTCRGDSGGPLVLEDVFGSRSYLVGVTSYGSTVCGANGTQGIYNNIYYYLSWIKKILNEKSVFRK